MIKKILPILLIYASTSSCLTLLFMEATVPPPLQIIIGREKERVYFEVFTPKSNDPKPKELHKDANDSFFIIVANDKCEPKKDADGVTDLLSSCGKFIMWDAVLEKLQSNRIYYGQKENLNPADPMKGPFPLKKGETYIVQISGKSTYQKDAVGKFTY